MEQQNISKLQLFVNASGQLGYYSGEDFEDQNIYIQWAAHNEGEVEIASDNNTDNTSNLINPLNLTNDVTSDDVRMEQYNCEFVADPLGNNTLQDLQTYEFEEVIIQEEVVESMEEENLNSINELINDSPISILSDECLMKIMMYFPIQRRLKFERVCKQWQRVAQLAWADIHHLVFKNTTMRMRLHKGYPDNSLEIQRLLTRCGKFLTDLELFHVCESKIMNIVNELCPNLIRFKFAFANVNANHFINIFSNMRRLESVWIEINGEIPGTLLSSLQEKAESLKELSFKKPFNFQDLESKFPCDASIPLFKSLQCLKMCDIDLTRKDIQAIAQNTSLIKLYLKACSGIWSFSAATNECINMFFNLKNLEDLHFEWIHQVDTEFIEDTVKSFPKLRRLKLDDTSFIDDYDMLQLSKLNHLEELYLWNQFGNQRISDLPMGKFPNLRKLDISSCNNLEDSAIRKLLKSSPNLELLIICDLPITPLILAFAARITRKRSNNIVLTITGYFEDFPNVNWNSRKYWSPFLIIKQWGDDKGITN